MTSVRRTRGGGARAGAAFDVARVSARRYLRDRTALLFMLVLPVAVILVLGATLRGFTTFRVGVVDLGSGPAGARLTRALDASPALEVKRYPTLAAARAGVARSEVSTAVILPSGMDAALRGGRPVTVEVLAEPANSTEQAAAAAATSVIEDEGARAQAAVFATARGGGTFDVNLSRASALQPRVGQATVTAEDVQPRQHVLPEGFSYSAPTMLVLFVFLNAIAGGAVIIETRRLGMYERMSAAPVTPLAIVLGECLTFVALAITQSVLIVSIAAVVFGVSWGNPVAAAVLIAVWAFVGAGAGMLSGTLFRTPEQATSIGPAVGIVLAMLGGCMWPLTIVTAVMREVGHATPQAWAVDAWTKLLAQHGGLASIAGDVAVLVAFAAALLALAAARLRRALV
jgi:ABC-2 type transport system permease protein